MQVNIIQKIVFVQLYRQNILQKITVIIIMNAVTLSSVIYVRLFTFYLSIVYLT